MYYLLLDLMIALRIGNFAGVRYRELSESKDDPMALPFFLMLFTRLCTYLANSSKNFFSYVIFSFISCFLTFLRKYMTV